MIAQLRTLSPVLKKRTLLVLNPMNNKRQLNVTVTGAIGHIGLFAVKELLLRGHRVRAFDLPTRANRKKASLLIDGLEIVWGDIRSPEDTARAVEGSDYVIHLAFILPSASERNPEHSYAVNVGGTGNLINSLLGNGNRPGILLASSFAIYGDTRNQSEPVTLKTRINPMNHYTRHKALTETMVRESGLPWCIFRLGAVMNAGMVLSGRFDSLIFEQPPDARQEFIHSADAALAAVNALETPKAWNKIHLVSGGKECQLEYRDLINLSLEATGIGSLPDEVFSPVPLQGGAWMDTSESQKLLSYQRHTYADHCRQIVEAAGSRRKIIKALSPCIRWYLKRMSPFYKRRIRND